MNMPYGWHGGYYNDEYVDYEYSGDYDYDDYEDYNGFTVGDSVDFDSSYPIHKADFKDTIPIRQHLRQQLTWMWIWAASDFM